MSSPASAQQPQNIDLRYEEYRRLVDLLHQANRMRDCARTDDAVGLYEEAIRWVGPFPTEAVWVNFLANVYTNLGIALLNRGTSEDLHASIDHFDRAISLRTSLLDATDPWILFGLCAGWMNRADALARIGGERKLSAAINSFDTALSLLNELPLDLDPQFPRRVAIAWINRGNALERMKMPAAADSFRNAIEVLNRYWCGNDQSQLFAAAYANLANALAAIENPDSQEILALARLALGFVAASERSDAHSAEAGLKARHALCLGIALELDRRSEPAADSLVSEATDAVEEGMELARTYVAAGLPGFQDLASQLFSFGCRIYQSCQPQFLSEYIADHLDAENLEMRSAASNSLWRALRRVRNEAFQLINTPRFPQVAEQFRQLCEAQTRLANPTLISA